MILHCQSFSIDVVVELCQFYLNHCIVSKALGRAKENGAVLVSLASAVIVFVFFTMDDLASIAGHETADKSGGGPGSGNIDNLLEGMSSDCSAGWLERFVRECAASVQ
jgi:hypothetical protein